MNCRFSKHVLNRMSRRGIKKEEVLRAIKFYQQHWVSKKSIKLEIFTLDGLRVVKNRYNGCIVTVYRYGEEEEEWHK